MISPKNSTAVTETRMAVIGSLILSRQMGSASMHAALASSRVTSSWWCLLTMGMMSLAYCFFLGSEPPWIMVSVVF